MVRTLTWHFPLTRTHTGALLGNGTQGLMVWGTETLNITVGRAGFWDHRGGNVFASKTTFKQLRKLLEAGDEAAIKEIFAPPGKTEGQPDRPQQVGCGRLELSFANGLKPVTAVLDMETAALTVTLANAKGQKARVVVRQSMFDELAWVEVPANLRGKVAVKFVSTWEYVGERLSKVGVKPPTIEQGAKGGSAWQELPADDGLACAWADHGAVITLATALGKKPLAKAKKLAGTKALAGIAEKSAGWWRGYWSDVPTLRLPDEALQRAYDYGVYKQAGLTTPHGVAASLQGPWLEEYQLPPWSCDYHFNINIQMIYWPALMTGRFDHFGPLWAMIKSWMPTLRQNAKGFFEADALMLPHAVDDRCMAVGQFWTGTIDHACTAWMAQMAWLHYRYSMDKKVLRDIAWPMLNGAFNGYWAMLEEVEANGAKRLSLPVSVSPEYGGSGMTAWGRDASFQLAAVHFLAATLPAAAEALGEKVDPRWERVARELPPYSTVQTVQGVDLMKLLRATPEELPTLQKAFLEPTPYWHEERRPGPRIALWQGRDLDTSHRHPSHLAGIYPFRTIDPTSERDKEVVKNSLYHWVREGGGAWSGWAIPFAAMIMMRCDLIEGGIQWLHIWDETFTNEGYGTLHDALFPGVSVIGGVAANTDDEIMQMDAGMGAITAIVDALVQCRGVLGEEIHVLPVVPRRWREFSFDGVWAEGAFRIGATVKGNKVREIRIVSEAGGTLKLVHCLGEQWTCNGKAMTGSTLELATKKGQTLVLKSAAA